MKTRLLHILLIIGAIFCISHFTSTNTSAQEIGSPNEYPEGTIEVPEGTEISIGDDEKTVTIEDCPVEIKEGDTFVIYLQDLPVGYKAESTSKENNDLVVEVEKADPSVYMLLDEEGDVELTSEMYEFAPARNVSYAVAGGKSDDYFDVDKDVSYKNGTLLMKVSMGGAEIQASLSNMHIGHQAQDGSISLGLSGDWRVKTTQSLSDDSLADLPLGEMRIKGIGKITLSLSLSKSMNLECNLAGTFNVGIGATQDGDGSASRGFTVNEKNITGKGEMSVSLKMTAGVDVLIAAADLYVDIGAETDYQRKTTIDPNTDKTTDCDNFRFYLFATMGAEAKYYSILTGKMTSLPPKEFWSIDGSNSQYKIDLHFENGQLVDRCTQGMVIPETEHGGFDVDFSGTILSDNRERIVETDIELPWDMTVDQDLTLSDGTLNLNGHTLTIEGDLIQSDGTLVIGEGTLIVKGDYRIQTKEDEGYGDSSGSLKISNSNGTINIDGNLVIQSTADDHVLTAGTINIKGNIEQINPKEGVTTFNSGGSCNINLTEENAHSIRFEDADNNSIGWLTLQNNADVEGDINLGRMDLSGHQMTVNGDMISTSDIDLEGQDRTFTGLSSKCFGIDAQYIFNHRRYSWPAAFGENAVQRKSQGSWKLGFSYNHVTVTFNRNELSPYIAERIDTTLLFNKVSYKDYAISIGYGYNWAFRRNCILAVSVLPSIGYRQSDITEYNEDKAVLRRISTDVFFRTSLFWNNTKYFTGFVVDLHTYAYRERKFSLTNAYGTVKYIVGFDFLKKKQYKQKNKQ